jgi:hypothetical protein
MYTQHDPQDLGMGFSLPPSGDISNFMTTIDGLNLFITKTKNFVTPGDVNLIHLNVEVKWKHDFSAGSVTEDDPKVSFDTYVRKDQ